MAHMIDTTLEICTSVVNYNGAFYINKFQASLTGFLLQRLFSKVVARLLIDRAGYSEEDILFAGLVSIDMTSYGGENIKSLKSIQSMSRNDHLLGPYDIVYTGGESLGCTVYLASFMMQTPALEHLSKKDKIYDCAYLVPKELLRPQDATKSQSPQMTNYAVVNSMGGPEPYDQYCANAVKSSDFVGFRDKQPLTPDSAVLTKQLFALEIKDMAKIVLNELFPDGTVRKYIAVQHKRNQYKTETARTTPPGKDGLKEPEALAKMLDEVSRQTNAVIVFFAAGTVRGHDDFSIYKHVASLMKEKSIVYEAENIWKVVALVSHAEAVFSTSLHVRIMAFMYFRPRITWCSERKHKDFIRLWDASDAAQCAQYNETWTLLEKYLGPDPKISQDETKIVYEKVVKQYLEFFDLWSGALTQNDYSTLR